MKKYMMIFALAAAVLTGCDKNENEGGTDGESVDGLVFVENGINYIGDGDKEFDVVGDFTLSASKQYVLRGWVYITDGSSITIPAGTVIKGKQTGDEVKGSSLIVERGGKIYANGTATQPIVFTSEQPAGQRKPGDWGGVIICGRAKNNKTEMPIEGGPRTKHGGTNDDDNSGVFKYVRIEFAGYPFETDQEINGLTMGSVGRGTELHHVQVSYSNDDSFEWFGGAVNCHHLVAYHGWDDDFDTDNGFSGTVQFILGVRHPKIADTSCSNGFESDNWANGTDATPVTSAKFCNVTLVGPIGQDDAFYNQAGSGKYITAGTLNPNNGSQVGQFQAGLQIRRYSQISIANSVVLGWPVGAIIENDKGSQTQTAANARNAIQNVFFGGYTDNAADATFDNAAVSAATILGSDKNKTWQDRLNTDNGTGAAGSKSFTHSYIMESTRANTVTTVAALKLSDPRSVIGGSFTPNAAANYGPVSGSPLVNASFAVPAGFDATGNGYAGAFKSSSAADDWTKGWANFDPQNATY